MLKNILNLEGTQEISASEQKTIIDIFSKEISSKCDANSIIVYDDCTEFFSELN
ncbi:MULTISPECIES: hypothetical protein [Flavobacterium]|uniref:Uncharacterized protein n=1 Tax=Flavobacterium panici TaxID=2654843 RepID=A0A9N8J090_9FLAO|nr:MULTISPECIES: hypothetical protein [Flavobacterium]UUF15828.1 hypothetical protein NLJ00_06835 [Flavobacterium panici]CAC9973839.1 hypothetical protein FLAPXU55_01528 [Flavobacterium panici]